jgi:CheY-like chemotaxis protein
MQHRSTILLVDDSVDTLAPLSRLLRLSGYDVRVARTAAEALALAAEAPADLMISDLGLPDRDGTDLMRDVKARFGLRGIAVTGYDGDDTVRRCRRAGFDRHFAKPIRFEQLRAAVNELLAPAPAPAPASV